jgi:hypothetical protein
MTKPQFGVFTPTVLCACALAYLLASVLAQGVFAAEPASESTENFTLASARLSPEVRIETLALPLPAALEARIIAPFLVAPKVIDAQALNAAAQIVSAPDKRTLLSRGDRVHATSLSGAWLSLDPLNEQRFDIFRHATPLKDPINGAVLGYEAQFLGTARLVKSEGEKPTAATLEILSAQEEIRVGDQLIASTAMAQNDLIPHAFVSPTPAHVVSIYASAVTHGAQNQVVVINRGSADGVEAGHVMAIQKRTQGAALPLERNGLALVLLPFAKVSYALVVHIEDSVRVGDVLTAP